MKYKTVVMDPPWPIKGLKEPAKFKNKRKPIHQEVKKRLTYDLMSMNDIYDFPIDDFAAEECLLFLWATCGKIDGTPVVQHALLLLEKWGFNYHTMLAWVKPQGIAFNSPIISRLEPIIFGWRGNFSELIGGMGVMSSNIITYSQIFSGQKPAKFYQNLRMWTPDPRIDIFARRAHVGFDGWGEEYVGNGPLAEFI